MKIDLDKMIKPLDENDPLFFVKARWYSFLFHLHAKDTDKRAKKVIKEELKKLGRDNL